MWDLYRFHSITKRAFIDIYITFHEGPLGRRSQDFTSVPYFYLSPLYFQMPSPRYVLLLPFTFQCPLFGAFPPQYSLPNTFSEVPSSFPNLFPTPPPQSILLPSSLPIGKKHKHHLNTTSRNTQRHRHLHFCKSSLPSLLLRSRCDDASSVPPPPRL